MLYLISKMGREFHRLSQQAPCFALVTLDHTSQADHQRRSLGWFQRFCSEHTTAEGASLRFRVCNILRNPQARRLHLFSRECVSVPFARSAFPFVQPAFAFAFVRPAFSRDIVAVATFVFTVPRALRATVVQLYSVLVVRVV